MSTFPDGLFQYGGAPVGLGSFFPALRKDAKIYFVDPANGNDNNSGLKPEEAMDTVAAAYAKTVNKQGDIVFLLGDGSTTGTARDVAIVWSNSNTHLIGVTAPARNKRARIAPATTGTVDVDAYTPYITLSGSGCVFANFSLSQGQSEAKASVGILISGNQNYLYNVDILTGTHDAQGDLACFALQFTGSENVVNNCMIGADTYSRGGTASANVKFGGSRNTIKDSILPMYADVNDALFVLAEASCGDRWHLMERCVCVNSSTVLTAAITLTQGITWSNTAGCMLLIKDSAFYGCADITPTDSTKVVFSGAALPLADAGKFLGIDVS